MADEPALDRWKVTRAACDAVAKLVLTQLRGLGDEGDDSTAEPVDNAPFLQQLGVAARPVIAQTLRGLGYRNGDEVWLLKVWDKAICPTDLDVGETRIFSAGTLSTFIRLLAASVVLDASSSILLGASATKGVNRVGDPIVPGTFAVTATSSGAPPVTTLTITYTPPGGSPEMIVITGLLGAGTVTPPGLITLGGQTGTGSSKVKAED